MESDNLNQLLDVQPGANENTTYINNLDTDKLLLLKRDFPEFGQLCKKYKEKATIFNIKYFPIDHHNETASLMSQIKDSCGNQEVCKIILIFRLFIFIILSI